VLQILKTPLIEGLCLIVTSQKIKADEHY